METDGSSAIPHFHARRLRRDPVAARRLVCRPWPRPAPTLRGRRADEGRKTAPRRARTDAPVPDRNRIYADMAALFLQDLANVEAGIYPLPADHDGSWLTSIRRSRLFFEDLPEIHRRRERAPITKS